MSVTGHFWRLTREQWGQLEPYLGARRGTTLWHEGEQVFADRLYSAAWMDEDRFCDLEKEWHLLHCLLTGRWEEPGEITPVPPPLGNVIRGGTETPFDASDGMTRYLLPTEVEEVAAALAVISIEDLCARIDIELVRNLGIYAWFPDSELYEIQDSVSEYYPRLVAFFAAAARDGDIAVLSLD